ncbi:aminotransferase class I/II-fold pyridoxal phosphate-dependent enzyme [Actinoplanes sp. NPDC051411]|uniref:aminotransferase class I/II-fold pyridoxal phosphate-dependent enzyme n=1 Tax=Actinoplanes sp. NPDC051411 TaxID=3155522 RepID=UPI00342D0A1F
MLSDLRDRLGSPTARGLADAVGRAVGDGALAPGVRLPPIREVATYLQLSPTTVSAAWQLLRRAGTIQTDGRRGTIVAPSRSGGPGRYRAALRGRSGFPLDLSTGVPDPALLPLFADIPLSSPSPSSYLDEPVLPELESFLRTTWPHPPERLAIFDGAMDAIDQIASGLLRLGDRAVVENPCFPPLLDLLEALGVRVVPVETDACGAVPSSLASALTEGPAAVFLQPRALNPTGASWSGSRAGSLAAVLARSGAYVVEDDSAGDVASSGLESLGRLLPSRTLHVRSFSKSHGPDLRLAAVSGPSTVLDPILERRLLGQGWTSRLLQTLLLRLLTLPGPVAAVRHARDAYAHRRATVLATLNDHGIVLPPGDGLNIWLPVRDEQAALLTLAANGIAAAAGAAFTVGPGAPHLRVTTGLISTDHAAIAGLLAVAAQAPPRSSPR